MNSRERILKALNFEEADRVPFDLAATTWSGITNGAYQNLLKHHGMPEEKPNFSDVIQQIVVPSEKVLDLVNADVRGVYPMTSHNWDVYSKCVDKGEYLEYRDEWDFVHHFPKDGFWFSLVKSPMDTVDFMEEGIVDKGTWPNASNPARWSGLREQAIKHRENGKIVFTKGLCAGLFEMHQRVRGMENAMMDSFMYPENSDKLIGKLADLKIEFWDEALNQIGDVIDIVGEGDDYGTQQSQLIAPDHFRAYYKPHFKRVYDFIKSKKPDVKILMHSCGNVRPMISDLIEIGVDILNPVHVTATDMEPTSLKKDFGKDIVFWGGGVDSQKILPTGTPQEVADDVKRNIEALAPGGGFVFAAVHNIQAEVPAANLDAMVKALGEYGKY